MNREEARSKIKELIERFEEHWEEYHHPDYKEANVRQDFINPFFKALGWDIDNEQGASEAYREVIYEDKVEVKGKAKAPDYGFRLAGSGKRRLFYVEAKKPSVLLKANREAAYQLRRYGSSAQARISVLTNFKEFSVYDCSRVPRQSDSSTMARLEHIGYKEYLDRFDFLYDTFSHDAVTRGRFDKFVKDESKRKGKETLDKRFVRTLDDWRKYLAVTVANNNHKLSDDEINFSVQQLIDRLIFLRFCEDRSVEEYGQLQKAVAKGKTYQNLFEIFRQSDAKYNSGLFDFRKDVITPGLKVDNKVIRYIVGELYYPRCNYEFSVMPVEVLGNAYEQFLGKVIHRTAASVRVTEKPEVRKAGGVFYTPQYIVDYIVKHTVGKLVEGKTPKEIEAIKIVDPACGSGSFLLGAFDYLINYHINWYHTHGYGGKKGKDSPLTPLGILATNEKKRILINNIFGVDIDSNAVEVTKLSLLLKCMEGETEASIRLQMVLYHDRVLPDLDNNIKVGNSLIDLDYYDGIDFGEERKVKAFSWKNGFPVIFRQGGFDAVIGNPPYIPIELFSEGEREYYRKHYQGLTRKYESSVLFILRGLGLLKETGLLGFISTQTWQTGENYTSFRRVLFRDYGIHEVINLPFDVFEEAYVDTGIFIFARAKQKSYLIHTYNKGIKLDRIENVPFKEISISTIREPDYKVVFDETVRSLSSRFQSDRFVELGHISISTQGLSSSRFSSPRRGSKKVLPFIEAKVKRYSFEMQSERLVDLKGHPTLSNYYVAREKILIRRIVSRQNRIEATIYDKEGVFKKDLNPFIITDNRLPTKYVLGLINSRLFSWLYVNASSIATKDDFRQTTLAELRKLPIRLMGDIHGDRSRQSIIVSEVDKLLRLNSELANARLPEQIQQLKEAIKHSDDVIDRIVYELYGLRQEEIATIEASF